MKYLSLAVFGLAVVWTATAQDSGTPAPDTGGVKMHVEGARSNWYVVPTGADLGFVVGPWKLAVGGGYENPDFNRDKDTGDPASGAPTKGWTYPNGTVQGRYTWSSDQADLWLDAGVTGYGDLGLGTRAAGAFSDWNGNTFAFFKAGATRDRRTYNTHNLEAGTFAEAMAEASPAALSSRGTDYYRLGLKTAAFLPLWDLDAPAQLFSALLAFRADLQWTDGASVPLPLLSPTEVRGYSHLYDAKFLGVATAELRGRLWSWMGAHDLVPVGIVFVDAGSYSGYADSANRGTASGFLAGVGIGGGLEVLGLATPTLSLGLPLVGGDTSFWYALDFNLRF